MRYRLTVELGYFVLMTWVVYGVMDTGRNLPQTVFILIAFVVPVALGLLIGRWWAVFLPVSVFLISVPAGYSANSSLEVPIWFLVGFGQLIAVPLVFAGVVVRKLVARSQAPREYPSAPGKARPAADPRTLR